MYSTLIVSNDSENIQKINIALNNNNSVSVLGDLSSLLTAEALIKKMEVNIVIVDFDLLKDNIDKWFRAKQMLNFELIVIHNSEVFINKLIDFDILAFIDIDKLTECFANAFARLTNKIKVKSELKLRLENLIKISSQVINTKISITTSNGLELINSKDIISVKALKDATEITLFNNEIVVSNKNISEFDILAQDLNFFRIHKSFIVNLVHVKQFVKKNGAAVIMSNKAILPIAVSKKTAFKKQIQRITLY